MKRIATMAMTAVTLAALTGCASSGSQGNSELAAKVRQAVSDSYGWPNEPSLAAIKSFSGRDAPRITVVTDLAAKDENSDFAMGLCRTVASVASTVPDFTGVYVTAGEGGRHLAECQTAR
jgi:hypothetical protein